MARETILLRRRDIDGRIDLDQVIDTVETCLAEHEKGHDIVPPKLIMEVADGIAACLAGYTKAQHALTMKNGQERLSNRDRGLPTIHVHVSLFDVDTGELLMISEGLLPTVMRTGASAAVAARHLARADASRLAVLGCGQLGRQAAQLGLRIRPIERLFLVDNHEPTRAALAEELRGLSDVEVIEAEPEEAATQADILFGCSNSRKPIVMADWVQPGTHLSCMGADLHEKVEVEPALIPRCRLFADSIAQCTSRGEVSQAIEQELVDDQPFAGTIGQVISGALPGRTSDDEITLFDGTGLGVQDTALASLLYEIALREGLGVSIDWYE